MRQQTPIITNEKNMPIFPTHLRHTTDVSMCLLERLWRKGATPPGLLRSHGTESRVKTLRSDATGVSGEASTGTLLVDGPSHS